MILGASLACGFGTYPSSMKWLKLYEYEKIDDETKVYLVNEIFAKK